MTKKAKPLSGEEKLRLALVKYSCYMASMGPDKEELDKITFSPEFEERMEKLIKRQKKFYFYMVNTAAKQVAMFVAIIIIALTTTTFSVKALREPFINFIVKTFEKFTSIVFNVENETAESSEIITPFAKKVPAYIPEGFTFESEFETEVSYQVMYRKDGFGSIMFTQNCELSSHTVLDTENLYSSVLNTS